MWFEFGICVQLRGNSAALCGLKKGASVASVVADATLLCRDAVSLFAWNQIARTQLARNHPDAEWRGTP